MYSCGGEPVYLPVVNNNIPYGSHGSKVRNTIAYTMNVYSMADPYSYRPPGSIPLGVVTPLVIDSWWEIPS